MDDRELIEEMIAGTHSRIREIAMAVCKKADEEVEQEMRKLGETLEPLSDEDADTLIKWTWHAPLTDMAVHLIRAIAARATAGECIVDEISVAAACAKIADADLKRATGIPDEHLRTVLLKMGEALIDVARARGPIEIAIDRRPYRIRAA
jgi:hypothetical protein